MSVFLYQVYKARLRKRLLTCVLKAEPGKPHIKRHEPGIPFFSLTLGFALQTSDSDIIIDVCVNSMSLTTSFKK